MKKDQPTKEVGGYDGLLTLNDLAHYLACSRAHAAKLIADGTVPSYKLGSLRRVRKSDVEAWIESQPTVKDRA